MVQFPLKNQAPIQISSNQYIEGKKRAPESGDLKIVAKFELQNCNPDYEGEENVMIIVC